MSSSVKIFRPWDRQEAIDIGSQKLQDTTEHKAEFTRVTAYNNELKFNQYLDQTRNETSTYQSDTDSKKNENTTFQDTQNIDCQVTRRSLDSSENSPLSLHCHLKETLMKVSESDHKRNNQLQDNQVKRCANISDSEKHVEKTYNRTRSPCESKLLEFKSLQRNGNAESCDSSRLHRRHSKKHRSKLFQEETQTITRSTTSSPINPSYDTSHLSQDSNYTSEFSNLEKQFYPDFRSLEFLPDDILDPILMSGLPLGAPLDPYWSNLALEYFKSHEQTMRAKHQRPKKFNCPHCNVAFSNNGQLKGHIRIHTGERPFKCDAESCGKSFTRNEELTRHKRIHSGLRPYPCTHCGKKFGRKDHLKKHLRTHFPQPRYVPVYPYMYAGGYTTVIM